MGGSSKKKFGELLAPVLGRVFQNEPAVFRGVPERRRIDRSEPLGHRIRKVPCARPLLAARHLARKEGVSWIPPPFVSTSLSTSRSRFP